VNQLVDRRRAFEAPLTIGVISDTHIYDQGMRQIPDQVIELFQRAGVGLIVHLGDANVASVLHDLAGIAPVLAVYGNNDSEELLDSLPDRLRFTVGRFTFAAIHGHGGRSAKEVVTSMFAGKVDVALFGHSHIPFTDNVKGTILFNPGSATDRRWHQHFGVGLISVTADAIDPELILYANPAHLTSITFPADS
jgi:putative phosphoesterase